MSGILNHSPDSVGPLETGAIKGASPAQIFPGKMAPLVSAKMAAGFLYSMPLAI